MATKKDAYYFSHDANAQDDPKCMLLIDQLGMEGYGIFWALIEKLRSEKDYKLPFAVIPSLARRWGTSKEKVETVVKTYNLFVTEDLDFFSHRLIRSMEERSTKARVNGSSKWGLTEQNAATRSQRLQEARLKGTHTKAEWEEMREWFGECVCCSSKENIVKDHITPIYQGGSDGLDNLQPLCQSCNSSKGPDKTDHRIGWCDRRDIEMAAKWLQNACGTPAERLQMPAIKGKETKGNNKNKGNGNEETASDDFFPDKTLHGADIDTNDFDLTIVYVEATTQKKIEPTEVERMWKAFKIQYFTGTNGYKDWVDVIQHFRDWLKNQVLKNKNAQTTSNPSTVAVTLETHKSDFQKATDRQRQKLNED